MNTTISKRILVFLLMIVVCTSSLPVDSYAKSEDHTVSTQNETSSNIEISNDQDTISNGIVEVNKEFDVSEDLITEDLNWHEDPYPVDLLIVEPAPDALEDIPEPEEVVPVPVTSEDDLSDEIMTLSEETYGDFSYTISNNIAMITKYNGTATEVTIPDNIDGTPVQTIGGSAFLNNATLQKVILPDSIKKIEISAFKNCSALQSITLSSELTTIGSNCFYGDTALLEITIPKTILSIGQNAFSNVEKIIFQEGLVTLPDNACYNASSLQTVVLPDSLQKIGSYAFYNCYVLSNITIPASVTIINDHAFYQCKSISQITLPANLATLGNYAFYLCTSLESIEVPANIAVLGSYVFAGCSKLSNVVLSDGLTKIGDDMFYNATALKEVTIPASITTFGKNIFYNSAEKITFADGRTDIPSFACYGANKMHTVIIPDTVTSIGTYAFYSCQNLKNITLPSKLSVIDVQAFYSCKSITKLQLPATVTIIGEKAFYNCTSLAELQLSDSLSSIGSYAFNSCYALQTLQLPASLTTIGQGAFSNCTNLHSLLIPASVTTIGRSAFYNSVSSIIFADGTTTIPANACDGAILLKEAAIPSSVTAIGQQAFYGCTMLDTISLSEGIVSVGNSAFEGDTALTIHIPNSLVTIGTKAFYGCKITKKCGTDASWVIDPGVKGADITGSGEIGNGSSNIFAPFEGDIQYIDISENITKIGNHAFEKMNGLESVVMGDQVKEIGSNAFDQCNTLKRIEFSKGLEKIDEEAFKGCTAMETVIFTGDLPQVDATSLPTQKCTAYYPKSNGSYSDDARNLFRSLKWKQWDDTLPERDVVLVLDVSGSMSGARIKKLQEAVCALVDEIGGRISNTRIGIVSYSSDAKVVLPFSTDVVRMKQVTKTLTSDGGTFYLKGFEATDELFKEGTSNVKSLILFSDGAPSDNRNKILEKAATYHSAGYYVYTVGLSPSENNRQLLIDIAGDESCYFEAENIDSLVERFVEMSDGIGRSGVCGDNVKWKYNDADKQLVIQVDSKQSGKGKMQDFSTSDQPTWSTYAKSVAQIMVGDGVTYLGANAFTGFENATRIQISPSVQKIGEGTFADCKNLKDIYYPGSEQEWKAITIGSKNDPLINATMHYNEKDPNQPDANNDEVKNVLIKPSAVTLNVGDTTELTAEIYPKEATKKTVTWSSSNTSVVTVTNLGKIKAVNVGKATITALSSDGVHSGTCDVTVTNNIPVINSLSLGGSENGIKVDDNIPILGGKTFQISLPVDLPVNCVLEDNKIKIGINIKKKNLYSYNSTEGVNTSTEKKKTLKEQFEDFKKDAQKANWMRKDEDWLKNVQDKNFLKANMPGMEKSVDVNCVGYVEGAWSEGIDHLEGSLIVTIKGSATAQTQLVVWVIPVTVNCEFSASGSIAATIGYNFKSSKWYGDVDLAFEVGISPYAGIGFGQWISGGVYGKGDTAFKITALSSRTSPGLKEWSIHGELGVKAYFAKKSASIAILDGTYIIYPQTKMGVQSTEDNNYAWEDVVVTNLAATSGIQNDHVQNDGTLVSDVYSGAKPIYVSAGSNHLLLYVTDDATRSLLNQTKLVFSQYDTATGTYGTATSVLENNQTADFEPEVYVNGNDIYVVWLNSTKVYSDSEDPSIEDYMKNFQIHVAKYDASTKKFVDLGSPQSSVSYAYLPKMTVGKGGKLQVAWAENKDNKLLGYSSNNTIYRAEYSNGQWTTADEINQCNAVTSLELYGTSSNVTMAYTMDQDNDMGTKEKDLYEKTASGTSKKITEGNISSISYTKLPGISSVVLAANIDGGLYYVKNGSMTQLLEDGTMNADSRFAVSGNKVMYLQNQGETRNISVANYIDGNWGTALLTHETGYIDYFSMTDGGVSYITSDAVYDQTKNDWNVASSIKVLNSLDYKDTELESIDYAVSDVYPGSTMTTSLYIKNNGIDQVKTVHVLVEMADDELLSTDMDVTLMPGESKPSEISFRIPKNIRSKGDILVTVTSEGDSVSSNNQKNMELMKADLEVTSSYNTSKEEPFIHVDVTNKGLLGSNMEMTITDETGKVIAKETALVKSGNIVSFDEKFEAEEEQTLTISVQGDADEFYEMNNITWQKVSAAEDLPENEAFGVKFDQIGSDLYNGLTYNSTNDRYEIAYTGAQIKPSILVNGLKGKLKEGVDYSVSYSNNTNVDKKGRPAKVTITGKGNYAGKKTLEFYIVQADLSVAKTKGLLTVPTEFKVQSGKKCSPVLLYGNYILKATDITLSNTKPIKSSTTVTITGKGNFTGTLSSIRVRPYTATEMRDRKISISLRPGTHVYDGEQQLLTYTTAEAAGELTVSAKKSKSPLVKDKDYIVKYVSNINAGTAKVIIVGMGDYVGTVTKTFRIKPDTTSAMKVSTSSANATAVYHPLGAKPSVVVYVQKDGGKELLMNGKDYKVTYQKNTAVGTGKYTVTFLGNYKGHAAVKNQEFTITAAPFSKTKVSVENQVYTKAGKYRSVPMVQYKGTLISSKNYTVTYYDGETEIPKTGKITLSDQETSKTITVKVTGKGNYQTEEIVTTYKIEKADTSMINLSKTKIVALEKVKEKDVPVAAQEYTGSERKPAIRVLIKNGKTWEEVPSDRYEITYINNTNRGNATILIKGNGTTTIGSKKATFKIKNKSFGFFQKILS